MAFTASVKGIFYNNGKNYFCKSVWFSLIKFNEALGKNNVLSLHVYLWREALMFCVLHFTPEFTLPRLTKDVTCKCTRMETIAQFCTHNFALLQISNTSKLRQNIVRCSATKNRKSLKIPQKMGSTKRAKNLNRKVWPLNLR